MIAELVVGGLIIVGVSAGISAMVKNRRPKLAKENIPARLGVLEQAPIQPLLEKLNRSLDDGYIQQVKRRFLEEHPKRTEDEFEWRLFELKRYFLLANILKTTPMFSEEVDEIWHDMLLFTQKYQVFSEKFLGKMLHHTPNTSPKPAPQDRAFFDWVFSQLFQVTQYSWKTWGNFFKHPLDFQLLKEFKHGTDEFLIDKYFMINEDNKETIEYLVANMKQQLNSAEEMYQEDKKGKFTKQRSFGEMTALSAVMVYYSYFYFDEYWSYAKAYAFANPVQYSSGCAAAVFCGSASSDHHSGDGGGGDSGGSSCSSCSSCGGGCSS
ncbi:hypothetical protein [Neobacillus sp. 19]|uniref:hypothetical protein n=1 Tax=Neobacillus sp. 19 TaxID=3394458 RepID=UPI003BF6D3C6